MGNKTLDAARAARLDEFHTRYGDALAGLEPFRDRLAGADILLDTNDGDWSAFWRVLSGRFDEWRIGRVRSVSWDPDWDTLFTSDDGGGRVFERTRHGVTERRLACAGSIDDDEVLAMAHEADLVVGNPPFSRMSDYLPDRADTDLLCLGPLTAATYRSVFPLVLSGRLHIASGNRGSMFFSSPAAGRLNPSALTRDGLVQAGSSGRRPCLESHRRTRRRTGTRRRAIRPMTACATWPRRPRRRWCRATGPGTSARRSAFSPNGRRATVWLACSRTSCPGAGGTLTRPSAGG